MQVIVCVASETAQYVCMAGYSGPSLDKKLGIKCGHNVVLLNPPVAFARNLPLPDDVRISHSIKMPPVDVVICFVDSLEDLEKRFSLIASRLHPAGGFWIAWRKRPAARIGKRSLKRPSDGAEEITEDIVRRIGLAAGMVDNKVCDIAGNWSALRLVIRLENRDAVAYRAAPPMLAAARPRRARRPSATVRLAARMQSGAGSMMRRARARATR
ncbi:MAG: hypothetical protein KBG15_11100 [Kofleriaceae bacterium]|nr:hypothetical protein [Kofleriaceae bacterium]